MTDARLGSSTSQRASSDDTLNVAPWVLVGLGGVLLLMGTLIMFTTGSAFVAILGGALFAAGGAFVAGYLVVRSVKNLIR